MLVMNLRVVLNVNDRQLLSLLCQTVPYRAPIPLLYDRHLLASFVEPLQFKSGLTPKFQNTIYMLYNVSLVVNNFVSLRV